MVDLSQRQLDERVRATPPTERLALVARLRLDAIRIAWAASDTSGPMTELERARFLLRRLYPDFEGTRLEELMSRLEAEWRAGTWTGFRRPPSEDLS
ncbi:MAG TPA: hypothetical protein VM344_08120 [Vitreimonas sp.]|nr:hypothetical protein [Vitreimonas sp.]